jgi:uncharacterized membrane protein YedE/YeeE
MTATSFTPIASNATSAALIGLAAVLLMAFQGRIAWVSGIVSRLLPPYEDREFAGRLAFVAGLVAAPVLVWLATGRFPQQTIEAGMPVLVLAGLLVGFGSVWGNGCTSAMASTGYRGSRVRSLVATAFMVTAILTVFVVRHWG